MSLKEEIKLILKKNNIKPKKALGQNFLVRESTLSYVVDLLKIKPGETVFEIGPGVGNLTRKLIKVGAKVVAIEKDETLAQITRNENPSKNLRVIEKDILSFNEKNIDLPYKLVGNIPYYLTGKILTKFLLSSNQPLKIVLMVQKEVGETIGAEPPKSTFLSTFVSLLANVEVKRGVRAEEFWPTPKVDSIILEITPKRNEDRKKESELIKLVRCGFLHPRKTLLNNLISCVPQDKQKLESVLQDVGLNKKTRAHELSLSDWEKLSSFF